MRDARGTTSTWYPGQEEQAATAMLVGACACGCCPRLSFACCLQNEAPKLPNDYNEDDDDDNLVQSLPATARIDHPFAIRDEPKFVSRVKSRVGVSPERYIPSDGALATTYVLLLM